MLQKKGTMWLLSRLKAGEVLTKETSDELMEYIGQLEISLDASVDFFGKMFEKSVENLLSREGSEKVNKFFNDTLVKEGVKSKPEKFEFSDGLVHREVCYSEELDSALADLAYHNNTVTNQVIVKILSAGVTIPGTFGLKC